MTFLQKLEAAIQKNNSLLSVGLDPNSDKIPKHLLDNPDPLFAFNKAIIDSTHDMVCVYKPQSAHYEKMGPKGLVSLEKTITYMHESYPEIPLILDAKRGDIGTTAAEYAKAAFDYYKFDAVTVNPYLGYDSIEPFLTYKDKGIIIVCRTSNPGAKDFQDLITFDEPFYMRVAEKIVSWHEEFQNCLMVVGATYPKDLKKIRDIAKDMFFLVPGIGAQGGDIEATLRAGLRTDRSGLILHSSRNILYASENQDFAEKARNEALKLRDVINQYRV